MKRLGAEAPFFLKFDTHGYENAILDGSTETLQKTQAIVMEYYGFQVAPDSDLFWQMCDRLNHAGFRLCDIVEVVRRPGDSMFWQCDAFFLRNDFSQWNRSTYAMPNKRP